MMLEAAGMYIGTLFIRVVVVVDNHDDVIAVMLSIPSIEYSTFMPKR